MVVTRKKSDTIHCFILFVIFLQQISMFALFCFSLNNGQAAEYKRSTVAFQKAAGYIQSCRKGLFWHWPIQWDIYTQGPVRSKLKRNTLVNMDGLNGSTETFMSQQLQLMTQWRFPRSQSFAGNSSVNYS